LDIQKLGYSKSFKGGHRHGHGPEIRNVSRLEVHLRSKEAVAAAYLRAAHAYMLISMPTETSTIFGVFQAILGLSLLNRTNLVLPAKVMRNENFASEIFRCRRVYSYAALQKLFTFCAAWP
jgi:hypothetical protein